MVGAAKQAAKRILRLTGAGRRALELQRASTLRPYLRSIGWLQSVDDEAVDSASEAVPWYTYPAVAFLSGRVRPDLHVFEFGGGNSTLWWSRRVARVVTLEHDKEWYEKLLATVPVNVELKYAEADLDGAYCRALTAYSREFDCVVIDGKDRLNCARNCLGALKDDGVIILDDSHGGNFREAYEQFFGEKGFRCLDFWGISPLETEETCTTVLYRDGNCLGI